MENKDLEALYKDLEVYRGAKDESKVIETQSKILDAVGITHDTMLSIDFGNFIYSSVEAAKELKTLLVKQYRRGAMAVRNTRI